ncbi:hypothetical protein [Dactylosporangium sp. NPDC000521]|uniref:hypothetical protein n=1 Tax=Dactylosporangium sp. NPDC000521 TaxID=3363975 RepID=UPI0036CBCA4C
MPSYDSARPKGSAAPIVRTVEDLPRVRRNLEPRDPIADLLRQVEDDIELETTSDRTLAEYRLTDHRLAQQVRFELTLGRTWDGHATRRLFDDLWLYALPVIKAFLKRNRMNQVLQRYAPDRGITMRAEDMVVLRNSDEERTALAVDIIAAAVESFRDNAIGKHKWKASLRNASLRTYLIGTCAFVYPRAYIKWSKAGPAGAPPDRRGPTERGMKPGTLVGGSVVTGLVGGMFQFAGVPWGAVLAIAVLGLLFTFVLSLAQVLVPQESHDKVLLWEKVLKHWDRRRTTTPVQDRPRPSSARLRPNRTPPSSPGPARLRRTSARRRALRNPAPRTAAGVPGRRCGR